MTDTPVTPFLLGPLKPKKWAHNAGPEVPTVTLPNATVAEVVADIAFAWDATAADYVRLTVDHTTGGLNFYKVN